MSKLITFILTLLMAGCFAPKAASPELDMLTKDVLKTKEGIQIQILPVDKVKVGPVKQ